ncbi:N-acetylmuramic acid 6-phosphate etherase [Virgibacillus sp. MSJ-26]|uniref:N-acetylmuramic acid 6-phosphate etherase n=1 Tax=Virgibacillus sp. MSJ-26 TaxID=2841522 RepID=UPI001C0FF5A4|nr:N-acetylmuramic acid 6-phosphate etherase [Virgibacillus sp. MSJ-26]MBU5467836.1 N-acetylmuramic acid 6-phosphate etherase [Virgibacillus sp. MSJ-26]
MLEKLTTEARNSTTMHLDELSTMEILNKMNEEDVSVSKVIENQLLEIDKAVNFAIESFNQGGRLIYIGAGTSGRLGILDAVECVPTFGSPKDMVQGIIAGGLKAFTEAVEGAEDNIDDGRRDLEDIGANEKDTVIGIAASGRTPYVIGALDYAKKVNSRTVSISCNKGAKMSQHAEVAIELETGPEVLTGSTRLKAGSAQKMVLNMISTTAMIGIGKVYENLMVDLKPTNQKLEERSKRIIMEATDVEFDTASRFYNMSGHKVKVAIIMILLDCSKEEALKRIDKANGFVRSALSN